MAANNTSDKKIIIDILKNNFVDFQVSNNTTLPI